MQNGHKCRGASVRKYSNYSTEESIALGICQGRSTSDALAAALQRRCGSKSEASEKSSLFALMNSVDNGVAMVSLGPHVQLSKAAGKVLTKVTTDLPSVPTSSASSRGGDRPGLHSRETTISRSTTCPPSVSPSLSGCSSRHPSRGSIESSTGNASIMSVRRSYNSSRTIRQQCDTIARKPYGIRGTKTPLLPSIRLRQLRASLLSQCADCLHDIFTMLARDHNCSLNKLMTPCEVCVALGRVNGYSGQAYFAKDLTDDLTRDVSLSGLYQALVGVCPEALLWELRCRLVSYGLWPHEVSEACNLVLRFLRGKVGAQGVVLAQDVDPSGNLHSDVVQATKIDEALVDLDEALVELDETTTNKYNTDAFSNKEACCAGKASDEAVFLTYAEWSKFCSILCLTTFECRKLFRMLGESGGRNMAGLQIMFEMVRGTVSPDVSLMSFTQQLLIHYGTLRDAFQSVVWNVDRTMWGTHFLHLAERVGVDQSAASKLWDVLSHPEISPARSSEGRQHVDVSLGLTEDMFVRYLLRWTPNEALDTLRKALVSRFPSFVDARTALRRQGLPGSVVLSPRLFRKSLRQVGILQADTDVVLSKVRALRDRRAQRFQARGCADLTSGEALFGAVTLDEVFEYMNSSFPTNSRSNVVDDELSALRFNLRRLRADQAQRGVALAYASAYEEPSRSLPPISVDAGAKLTALLPGEEETLQQKRTLFSQRCLFFHPCT